MRRRMGKVSAGLEPRSMTVVKPRERNMSASWASRVEADFHSENCHLGSVKWTWAFQKPAVTVQPLQGTSVATSGTGMLGPTAAMRPSRMRMEPLGMGEVVGDV